VTIVLPTPNTGRSVKEFVAVKGLRVFITGPPGIGKTTVVKRVMANLEEAGLRAGGIYCPEIRSGEQRLGFEVIDLFTGRKGILSHVLQRSGPRIGKYRVNLEDLARIGVHAINIAVEEADYIVIDEVGPMELQGRDFQLALVKALESDKPVLGILHWRMQHPLIDRIKAMHGVSIHEVTRENRDSLPNVLSTELQRTLTPQTNERET
jgi:nucleoside-triphosphatase